MHLGSTLLEGPGRHSAVSLHLASCRCYGVRPTATFVAEFCPHLGSRLWRHWTAFVCVARTLCLEEMLMVLAAATCMRSATLGDGVRWPMRSAQGSCLLPKPWVRLRCQLWASSTEGPHPFLESIIVFSTDDNLQAGLWLAAGKPLDFWSRY